MTSDDDLRIRSILIVGGGTAGWMAAAHLNRTLGSSVRITLIESKVIGRIGVGEATVPTLRFTMKFLGLEDRDWMPHCNATYKTAVRFNDWNRPPGADGSQDYFYHPFFERNERLLKPFHGGGYFPEKGDGLSLIHAWHRRFLDGHRVPFAYACLPGAAICDNKLAPRQIASDEYAIVTAYHVDAFGVGDFLRDLAVSRGVEHIYDDVVGATLDARGYVDDVMTSSGRRLKADLFLDCTGFRGTLINGALNVPFRSESGSLLCDAAVAMPAASDPPEEGLRPYTSATARGAGWIWEIPLVTRYGTGYVYSSSFLDRDAAESELRQFLGAKSHGSPANHIKMRVGRNERMWEKNCVSIGLSSCFVEPLESTTIFLIEYALANLVTFFPDRRFHPARTGKFNDAMERMFDEIRDFIILHYVLAGRDETPFWKAVHRDTVIPDTLAQQLEFLEEGLPMLDHFSNFVFRERSYTCVLDGLGKLPRHALPLIAHLDPKVGEAELEASARMTEQLLQSLPGHREYIAWLHDGKAAR